MSPKWNYDPEYEEFLKSMEPEPDEEELKRRKKEVSGLCFVMTVIGIVSAGLGAGIAFLLMIAFATDQATAKANAEMLLYGIIFIMLLIPLICIIQLTVVDWLRKRKSKKNGGTNNEEKNQ